MSTKSTIQAPMPDEASAVSVPDGISFPQIQESIAPDTTEVMTIDQLVDFCARLQPKTAAIQEDSSLCVTPLITQLIVDGQTITLSLDEQGRWGAGYVRVSDIVQRSAKSATSIEEAGVGYMGRVIFGGDTDDIDQHDNNRDEISGGTDVDAHGLEEKRRAGRGSRNSKRGRKKGGTIPDGFSEEEQITRQVRYFIQRKQAFRIYSDAGITGEYPTNDPTLILRLLKAQADRYEKIFTATLLDETSLQRRGAEKIALMRAYLQKRVARIRQAALSDEEIEASEDLSLRAKLRLRSGAKRVYFRQAFTQLWDDVEAGCVHAVAVSDLSRLCRSADMETEFLRHLEEYKVRLHGLVEDLSSLDVSSPLKKGVSYFLASINEYRLAEIAGHSLRGVLQMLELGRPNGRLPWWLERDENGMAQLLEERKKLALRIVEMALSGMGIATIANQLHDEGIRVGGYSLTRAQIRYMLKTKALTGVQAFFGLDWPVYVPVIDDQTFAEVQEQTAERSEDLKNLHDTRTWAEHLFTGVCWCACGSPLFYQHGAASRPSQWGSGYYACRAAHKESGKDLDAPLHAYISEERLATFISEVFRDNPRIIADAISSESDRASQRRARRAVLEEELRIAMAQYEKRVAEVELEVIRRVKDAGFSPGQPGYEEIFAGYLKNAISNDLYKLEVLQQERALLMQEASKDKRAERAIAVVNELAGWEALDTRSRNRLLRAIFSSITVYALGNRVRRGRGGYLELKLAGTSTPLPPVKMRRGYRRGVDLPTAAEWISDIFASSTDSVEEDETTPELFRQFHPSDGLRNDWTPPELSAEQHEKLTAVLTKGKNGIGRPACDPVPVFLGILWRFLTGAKWLQIDPERFGAGYTACHRYFKKWFESGMFHEGLALLAEDNDDTRICHLYASMLDGTFERRIRG